MSAMTDDIVGGAICAECLTPFRKAHGYPVLCKDCFKHAANPQYPQAVHREAE